MCVRRILESLKHRSLSSLANKISLISQTRESIRYMDDANDLP